MTIGISNTAVRFASGYVTKIPLMTPLLVNNIGLAIAGLVTLLVPFCYNYTLLLAYSIVWGGFIGKLHEISCRQMTSTVLDYLAFHVSLSPVIICQLVGLEQYSSALGLTLMFRGITSLAAPPVSDTHTVCVCVCVCVVRQRTRAHVRVTSFV
jgi:hypothetical protein